MFSPRAFIRLWRSKKKSFLSFLVNADGKGVNFIIRRTGSIVAPPCAGFGLFSPFAVYVSAHFMGMRDASLGFHTSAYTNRAGEKRDTTKNPIDVKREGSRHQRRSSRIRQNVHVAGRHELVRHMRQRAMAPLAAWELTVWWHAPYPLVVLATGVITLFHSIRILPSHSRGRWRTCRVAHLRLFGFISTLNSMTRENYCRLRTQPKIIVMRAHLRARSHATSYSRRYVSWIHVRDRT